MIKTHYNPESKIWHGPMEITPVFHKNMSLGQAILFMLSKDLNKVGQISDDTGVSLTNQQLQTRIIRIGMNLQKLGYKKGDMIGIACKNSENLAPVILGCCVIGAPFNTLDPTFEKSDIAHMFSKTKPKLVFCDYDNVSIIQEALNDLKLTAEIVTLIKPVEGLKFIGDFITEVENEHQFVPTQIGDGSKHPAVIICSSGTTGLSKGVTLSHAQLLDKVLYSPSSDASAVILCFSSIYWLSGLATIYHGIINGSTRIITTEPFSPELTFKLIEKYKVTTVTSPPSQLGLILQSPNVEKANLTSVTSYYCGGSICPSHFIQQMNKLLKNGRVFVAYGISEMAGLCALDYSGIEASIGQLAPMVSMKLLSEDGTLQEVEENGEICMKSNYTFLGYYGDEQETKTTLDSEGWLHTGDIGHFDKNGNLFIVDRKKDILKYKNYQISPSDIESVIIKHSKVSAVCVIGIPDEIATDLPAAVIVLRDNSVVTENEIFNLVAESMSDYKKLRGGVYFVKKLPMTPSGKVQKNKVRKMAIELYKK